MGIADAIVDLVSSGTTLRENNLKEIEGGVILESQVIAIPAYIAKQAKCNGILECYLRAFTNNCRVCLWNVF